MGGEGRDGTETSAGQMPQGNKGPLKGFQGENMVQRMFSNYVSDC